LVRTPKLAGKIKVKFIIGGNGFVTTTGVSESSVHNPTLENCIAARVKTWEFPKPKGGGVAIVSYPFVFKQSGE
jgi:outer membrane biosynthesis protein TonB